jgi:hypothetical protein
MTDYVIRPMGMEHDRPILTLHSNDRKACFSPFKRLVFRDIHDGIGQQEFQKPSRIRKERLHGQSVEFASHEKPVRAAQEAGFADIPE